MNVVCLIINKFPFGSNFKFETKFELKIQEADCC
jgi:hypothetical protein